MYVMVIAALLSDGKIRFIEKNQKEIGGRLAIRFWKVNIRRESVF